MQNYLFEESVPITESSSHFSILLFAVIWYIHCLRLLHPMPISPIVTLSPSQNPARIAAAKHGRRKGSLRMRIKRVTWKQLTWKSGSHVTNWKRPLSRFRYQTLNIGCKFSGNDNDHSNATIKRPQHLLWINVSLAHRHVKQRLEKQNCLCA